MSSISLTRQAVDADESLWKPVPPMPHVSRWRETSQFRYTETWDREKQLSPSDIFIVQHRGTGTDIGPIFHDLVEIWREETEGMSSITRITSHYAYKLIIKLSWAAVPLLLHEMQQRPSHWHWALKAITGVDPTTSEDTGKIRRIANAWIEWGRINRILA
jgi:hypothetical protein